MYRGKCILKPRAYFGVCTPDFSNMTSIGDITQSPEVDLRGRRVLFLKNWLNIKGTQADQVILKRGS